MVTTRLPLREQRAGLPIAARRFLIHGQKSAWYFLSGLHNEAVAHAYWDDHSDWVVQWHVKHWPGTRPRLWWKFDSPGQRLRLGGIGDTLDTCSAYAPQFDFGLPVNWRRADQLHFDRGTPIDDRDPPRFESEVAYLKRLRLLLPGEARRLRPRDYRPVAVQVCNDRVELHRVDPT
jgi:hypothetical protein